jgi:hypothetical protein
MLQVEDQGEERKDKIETCAGTLEFTSNLQGLRAFNVQEGFEGSGPGKAILSMNFHWEH